MRFRSLAAVAAFTVMSPAAYADFIPSWDYTVTSFFDTTSTQFAPASGGTTNTPTLLSWGTPFNPQNAQSALEIFGNPATQPPPAITDSLIPVPTQVFEHRNNVILGNSLDAVNVITTITLVPSSPPSLPDCLLSGRHRRRST